MSRWRGIRNSIKRLKLSEYDLAVAHFALYTFPILNQIGDLPLVFHFHGPWALESSAENQKVLNIKLKKLSNKLFIVESPALSLLSQAFKNILHDQYGISSNKIHVVPGGVDYESSLKYRILVLKLEPNWAGKRSGQFFLCPPTSKENGSREFNSGDRPC